MEDLSLHILDVVENGTAAGATLITISIREDTERDWLELRIKDNGRGMDDDVLAGARDPFVTTRTTRRVGLGLPLLNQATQEAEGHFEVHSQIGQGTEVVAGFRRSHIDRKPLGDIASTMITLLLGNPEVDFVFEAVRDHAKLELDTRELKKELEGVPLSDPAVLGLIRDLLRKGPQEDEGDAPEGG